MVQANAEGTAPLLRPAGGQRLTDAFVALCAQHPGRAALRWGSGRGHSATYQELESASNLAAQAMVQHAGENGRVVAILCSRCPELVVAILACARSGVIFAVLDASYPEEKLSSMLATLSPTLLVGVQTGQQALLDRLASAHQIKSLALCVDWPQVLSSGQHSPAAESHALPPDRDTPAYLLFTSGTTGDPKCIATGHAPLIHFVQWYRQVFGPSVEDRFSMLSGLGHDPVLRDIFVPLSVGAQLFIPEDGIGTQPAKLFAWLQKSGISFMHATPQLLRVAAAGATNGQRLSALRWVFSGGDQLRKTHVDAVHHMAPLGRMVNFYGSTETPQAMAFHLLDKHAENNPVPVGRGIDDVQLLVLDNQLRPCLSGTTGQVCVRTFFRSLGYLGDAALTYAKFRSTPGCTDADDLIYLTGDLGYVRDDGAVVLTGRLDDQIKIRGFRVELGEVVRCIDDHPRVQMAEVLVDKTPDGEKRLTAFVVAREGDIEDRGFQDSVRAFLQQHLPAYMVPAEIVVVPRIPLLPNGKTDRAALRAQLEADQIPQLEAAGEDGGEFPAMLHEPDSFFGRWRRELAELLGLRRRRFETVMDAFQWSFPNRRISPRDTFISLSGDSLTYVTVSLGLDELVPKLPEDWAERSIDELQALCGSEAAAGTVIRPDILLRVVAMFGVLATHSTPWTPAGAAKLMMLISGLSFARFTWNEDPHRTLWSALRFTINIVIPTLIFLAVAFTAIGRVDWPLLLFINNLMTPKAGPSAWWGPTWYIQCLVQYLILMVGLGFVPGVATFAAQRKYLFGAALTVAGVAAYVGFRVLATSELTDYEFMPQDYFWLFAFGWLISAAETRNQKLGIFALLLVSIGAVLAANAVAPQGMYDDFFWAWLLAGAAVLLTGWSFSAPRWANIAMVTLARSMLFVYLLHVPLALLAPVPRLKLAWGFFASLVIWAVWESLSRTVASYWPTILETLPKMGERGSKTGVKLNHS